MRTITLRDLMTAVGGRLIGEDRDPDTIITGAQSDNRLIKEGNVFFAFPGERVDGHRFAAAALQAGASGAVVTRDPGEYLPGKFYLLVGDAIAAYGDLARWYRAQFDIPVVGITGSVGKTTTKDMVSAVLAQRFRTAHTEGNYNNNIGLPRTVLTLEEDTEAAVIEMGMNHPGEIAYLTKIARPTIAVITNIGDAHIGNLGSRENIFRAKCEIFDGMKPEAKEELPGESFRSKKVSLTGQSGRGLVVLNGDDEYLVRLREDAEVSSRYHLTYVGEQESCDWRASDIEDTPEEALRFTAVTPVGTFPLAVPARGHHLIYPALTAAAVGASQGLSAEEIRRGIASYEPTKMRMETFHLAGNVVVYNDTYNANPQSMKAGLLTLSRSSGRRIAVLGDMFELGALEETLHREVGAFAASLPIDTLVTVGVASAHMARAAGESGLKDVRCCADKEEAKAVIRELAGPDTVWLFKASRGMALEELVHCLRN